MTAAELLMQLDAACLCRRPEQSLRSVTNAGRGFWIKALPENRYISTHIDADLCALADVIEKARASVGMASTDSREGE